MVEISKGHEHNRPQTICRITSSGRKRYVEYLSALEQVIRDAAKEPRMNLRGAIGAWDESVPRLIFLVHQLCNAK